VVAPDKRAGAVAAMFMGLTLATIGGVPLATWFGELLGWRTAFWGIGGLGLVTMVALWFALPNLPLPKSDGVLAEIKVLGRGSVLAALALTVVGSSAMFTVFTYIAPILSNETHASTPFITAMLVLFGVGLTLGNIWGGKAADRSIDRTLIVSLSALILVLLAFAFLMRWPIPAAVSILIWGIASFAVVPPLQMRVMEAAKDAPNLASAVNIGAFNFGNAIGAAVGGAVINAGLGYPAISLAGAAMAGLGLLMVVTFAWGARGRMAAAV
jgi:DHA1 family inner membrane transport protein